MKQILFSGVAAILTVVGLSSYKNYKKRVGPYYFMVRPGLDKPSNVGIKFLSSEVIYVGSNPDYCPNAGFGYDCIVTFTSHLNSNKTKLTSPQAASSTIWTKGSSY